MTETPRPEYPRPGLRRERWLSLNGNWSFAFDDRNRGLAERWYADPLARLSRRITVPFCFQSELSGIGEHDRHDVVWYARKLPDPRASAGERLLLHFGAVDYRAQVWVDGVEVAQHEGGHTPFTADVTDALGDHGDHVVAVRVHDPYDDLTIPRGKQYWHREPEGIFYPPTTGIWQSVWLEPVPALRIEAVHLTPDVDGAAVDVEIALHTEPGAVVSGTTLHVEIALAGMPLVDDRVTVSSPVVESRYSLLLPSGTVGPDIGDEQGLVLWSPEHPNLYDVRVELLGSATQDAAPLDAVESYFGLRKFVIRKGRVELNNRPYYQRLVLDQGYFPGGQLTAGTDEELRRDIELAKELGFNGARKHQKIEDPRWLYWADRLGFLVWAEMPSAYRWSTAALGRVSREWQEAIERDRDHPCVVAWVPMNESWGVPRLRSDPRQVHHLLALHHLTHALDTTRLVVTNDGWENVSGDMLTVHDYGEATALRRRYATSDDVAEAEPQARPLFVFEHGYRGEPVFVTEFGGISFTDRVATWGYDAAADATGLVSAFTELISAIVDSSTVQGFCWTQLTDVYQETNGLLTADRRPKADPALFREAMHRTGKRAWTNARSDGSLPVMTQPGPREATVSTPEIA